MHGLPFIVEDFKKKLSTDKSTYVFAIATFGGMPGNALKQVDTLMKEKDTILNAGFILNMPGNNIVMYGAKYNKIQIKFEKEKVRVQQIVDIIKEKKNYGYEKSKIVINRILGPIFYKKMSSVHSMGKLFLAKHNCEQCLACIQYCPNEAIEYGDKTIGRKRYNNPNISLKEMINEWQVVSITIGLG